jgi:hypothetical protein
MLSFWREALLVALSLTILFLYQELDIKKKDIALKDIEIQSARDAIEIQNKAVLENRVDYEKKISELPKAMKQIEVKYKTVYEKIEVIKEDKNATCEKAISTLNDFVY